MAILLFSLATLFFTFALALHTPNNCNASDDHQQYGSTLQLININSPCSPFRPKTPLSWPDTVLQMQSSDINRLNYLASLLHVAAGHRTIVPIASGRAVTQKSNYIVRAKIGTPAQTLLMAIDTSNDAAWIPCAGCAGCTAATTFDSSKSATFKPVGCGAPQCNQDNFTLGTDSVSRYTFGCIQKATGTSVPAQGLLGLGRGPLSLLSQTSNLYQSTFSYCLPSYKSPNFSGSLRLGPNGQPTRIRTTQLLKNSRRSSLYYANLMAIRVGRRVVNIPSNTFAFDPTTGAGTVFDSGTVFSILVKPAYTAVRDEVRRQMGSATVSSLGGFDTCYTVPVTVPAITLMFSGLNMSLPQDNFLIHSTAGSTSCLAMAAAPDSGVNSVLNVIATFQQQNHRILFDLPNSKLGVAREPCS